PSAEHAPERSAARAMVAAALAAGHAELERSDLVVLLAAYDIALNPYKERRASARAILPAPGDSAATDCGDYGELEQALAATRLRVRIDPVFGPVIVFGQGGVAAHVSDDRCAGLPPLNMVLARDMVERTRVAKLLAG